MIEVTRPCVADEQTPSWKRTITAHSEQKTPPWVSARSDRRGSREAREAENREGTVQSRVRAGRLSKISPAPMILFQVVTDGRSFLVRETPAGEDPRAELHRPRFHLVQSFPNRREAEAYRQYVSTLRDAPLSP